MRFALMIEAQQGLSYEDQLAIVRRAEAAGFDRHLTKPINLQALQAAIQETARE